MILEFEHPFSTKASHALKLMYSFTFCILSVKKHIILFIRLNQISKKYLLYIYTYTYVGQGEVENTVLITDEPMENDSIAFYFCSPKITANCEYYYIVNIYICMYVHA